MFFEYLRELTRPGAVTSQPCHQPRPAGVFVGPLQALPVDRREVIEVYGDPGLKGPSRAFKRRLTIAKGLPGAWNNGRGRLYCHELAEPYLREALERCQQAGVLREIERLGCYTHRHQRHDPKRPLSYHSWGIALDINPGQNKARTFAPTMSPQPFGRGWQNWWPNGLSQELVECFESVGWRWGGRWKTFRDPMHMELVR